MTDNVIIIPTRLEATRLPNKPLKKINNKEMILHVHQAAKNANIIKSYEKKFMRYINFSKQI